ncbi:response regulator transcription factor [Niastella sp. OAS944]|uniref:response regulator n=1 Tax=Niastella sp. OAS944 TaxID=2664089 RepID=UPI003494E38F|nr:DNA-binding NarL/FixJ family response regulator [Chitinophagaceae bacterium OAS944]
MENQLTVAVVDDHALLRKAVNFRLTSMGYKVVIEAENGKQFLDKLESSPSPDLCLLDINMPEMNGFETAVELRKRRPGIKILFFSMQNGRTYMKKAMEMGADGYLCKDASTEEFTRTLSALLPQPMSQAV